MPRGRHRHSSPLHRLLPPSAIAGVSVVCASAPWVFSEATVLRALAAAAAATSVLGAFVMRRWDVQAGRRVTELTRARAGDEWRFEERVAELETDLEESRELRAKLEQRLRAKRAELAGLRNEHAALLRRYATAETERASALEGRRLLELETTAPEPGPARPSAPALPPARGTETSEAGPAPLAAFSPEGARLYRRALTALSRFDREPPHEPGGGGPRGQRGTTSGTGTEGDAPGSAEPAPAKSGAPEAVPGLRAGTSEAETPGPGPMGTLGAPEAVTGESGAAELRTGTLETETPVSGTPGATAPVAGPARVSGPETAGGGAVVEGGTGSVPVAASVPGAGAASASGAGYAAGAAPVSATGVVLPAGSVPGAGFASADGVAPASGSAPVSAAGSLAETAGPASEAVALTSGTPASASGTSAPEPRPVPATGAQGVAGRPRQAGGAVPPAAAVVAPAPVRRPVTEGGFDFFGTQKGAPSAALDAVQNEDLADVVGPEALAVHKAEAEAAFKPADERSRGVGQVIDLTAHDETEQIDVQGLRSAAS
ncbi:hypothetical protein [Streptomyces sp. SCL15-4]|uniref:hypothetical protein n=1 Tax=Streptomyces sp. SCL15-4 TaxID=2967221 RepID=UPI002966FD3F|nr:hypothetical protein [Streptomyces sp. SCL15-4]